MLAAPAEEHQILDPLEIKVQILYFQLSHLLEVDLEVVLGKVLETLVHLVAVDLVTVPADQEIFPQQRQHKEQMEVLVLQ